MIKYKIDVLAALKEKGYSTYKLSKNKHFSGSSIQKMRDGIILTENGLSEICKLLECDISEIIEFVPDSKNE